jgi:hypothetical protein
MYDVDVSPDAISRVSDDNHKIFYALKQHAPSGLGA